LPEHGIEIQRRVTGAALSICMKAAWVAIYADNIRRVSGGSGEMYARMCESVVLGYPGWV